jgi:peroxiredoxin Q/BCP
MLDSQIPNFSLPATSGLTFTLNEQSGKIVVIYFYPKDSTPGCTTEAQQFRDLHEQFVAVNAVLLGISRDSVKSHENFKAKQNLPFNLIADTDKKLSEIFGTWGEKSLYGKQYMGTFRTTFIIDETGTITRFMLPKEVNTKTHASQIL